MGKVICKEYGSFEHKEGIIVIGLLCSNALEKLKIFYENLDRDTIRRRFLAPIKEFSWYIKMLKESDAVIVVAVHRRSDERIIASAEAVPTGEDGTVEAGIVVERGFRRLGIGKRLAIAMYIELERRCFRKVVASVHPDNEPALKLAERVGFRKVPGEPGIVMLELVIK